MKAVLLEKAYDSLSDTIGTVNCYEVKEPNVQNDDEIKIKIEFASICGSDPNTLRGFFPNVTAGSPIGHEMSGIIVDMGEKATRKGLKIGDKVTGDFFLPCGVCNNCMEGYPQFCSHGIYASGAMAQFVVWKERQVYKLPDNINMMEACLAEPFSIATHAVEIADMKPGARVCISGGGGIGMMLVQLAKMCGASSVTLIEPVEKKRMIAKQLGADYTICPGKDMLDEVREITGDRYYDVIFESSGNSRAAESCLQIAGYGCHIVYFSMYPKNYCLPFNLLENCYHKEIRIQGMYLAQGSFSRAISLLPRINMKPLISSVYSLDECKPAFEEAMSGRSIKVLFDCWK